MKIRPFIDRRNSIAQLFVVLLCVGILAVLVATWTQAQSSPNGRAPIDVVVLEDGTKEHVLINDGQDRLPGTADDQYWVLHVPADVYSISGEDIVRESQGRKPGPRFTFNRDLTIRLPYAVDEAEQLVWDPGSDERIRIGLQSTYVPYRRPGRLQAGSFMSSFQNSVANDCAVVAETSEGLFQLRDLTEEELQQKLDDGSISQVVASVYRGCGHTSDVRTGYSIYVDQTPIGWMSCTNENETTLAQICDAYVWMEPDTIVAITLPNKYLQSTLSAYSLVQAVILDFTKSREMKNMNLSTE